jgi:hypothetical protein
MENLEEVKLMHQKVQDNIFEILLKYRVLSHVSSTLESKASLYFIAEDYKFMFCEIPAEVSPFMDSINRLLEIGYLSIISDPTTLNAFFITKKGLEQLSAEEQQYFVVLPEKVVNNLIERQERFNFLGEIL